MQFYKESNSIFNKAVFNKHKTKIFIMTCILVYIILAVILIARWRIVEKTVPVVVTKGNLYKNQIITENNITSHNMNYGEYLKYGVLNKGNGQYTNLLVLWENKDSIIGKYSGVSKGDHEYLYYRQILSSYVENSRLLFYDNPGKSIVELDITNSNLKTFKNYLKVGDKINIGCTYESSLNLNISELNSNRGMSKEVETIVVNDLFTAVEIADITNKDGLSLLDYTSWLEDLPTATRLQIEKTQEFKDRMEVDHLLLALTPEEEKRYRYYKKKQGIKFDISIPNMNTN